MKIVAHFSRVFLNFTETFIKNQIDSHTEYNPIIIFKEKVENNNHASSLLKKYPALHINNRSIIDKVKYKYLRCISQNHEKEIIQFLKENKVSILHFHYGTDAGMYANIIKKMQIPSVVSFYGYDCSGFPSRYMSYGKKYLKNKVFKNVTKVLAMSPDMKNDLIAISCPSEKIIVHYYGTDIQKFLLKERKYEIKEKYTLLILASLTPQKGHLFLFKAIKELVYRNTCNFVLRVIGDGFLKYKLQKWVIKHQLSEYIEFKGSKIYGSEEMINEFHSADIFIHPSITASNGDKEGIPGAIIEAMASGLPIISTNHAGIPYAIEHDNSGILVNENDVMNLTNSIQTIINDKFLRKKLGENAQHYAEEYLDLKIKEQNLEEIYTNLIVSNDKINH